MVKRKQTNQKKKKTKQKKNTNVKQGTTSAKMNRMPKGKHIGLAKTICSISNPFCPEAEGAKIPDTNTTQSCTYCSKQILDISTNAQGRCAYAFSCAPTAIFAGGNIDVGTGNITAWGTPTVSTFNTVLGSVAREARVVSWGVKLYTTAAWTAASGTFIASEMADNNPFATTGQNISSLQNGVSAWSFAVRDAQAYMIGRGQGMDATHYAPLANAPAFCSFMLTASGAPVSTSIATAEITINYEWIPITGTSFTLFATPPAPSVPQLMDIKTAVYADQPSVEIVNSAKTSKDYDKSFMDDVMGSIEKYGPMAMSALEYMLPLLL